MIIGWSRLLDSSQIVIKPFWLWNFCFEICPYFILLTWKELSAITCHLWKSSRRCSFPGVSKLSVCSSSHLLIKLNQMNFIISRNTPVGILNRLLTFNLSKVFLPGSYPIIKWIDYFSFIPINFSPGLSTTVSNYAFSSNLPEQKTSWPYSKS